MIETYLRAKRIGGRYVGRVGSTNTIEAYRTALQAAERLVETPLIDWTSDCADELLARFDEESLAPSYRANVLAALRGFFTWAIATNRYDGPSPMLGIQSPRISRTIPTILSEEQVRVFFSHLSGKYKTFFELQYFGGLRIGEVCNLRCEDVRDDGIVVRGKGDKQRFVPLPSSILSHVKDQCSSHTYVFYGESPNAKVDAPMTLATARSVFDRARKACGFSITPHNLRHTSATHFHEKVGDLAMTSTFLGHARPETTMIYAQIANSKLKEAATSVFGV